MLACPCRRTGPGLAALTSGEGSDDYGLIPAVRLLRRDRWVFSVARWLVRRGRGAGAGVAAGGAGAGMLLAAAGTWRLSRRAQAAAAAQVMASAANRAGPQPTPSAAPPVAGRPGWQRQIHLGHRGRTTRRAGRSGGRGARAGTGRGQAADTTRTRRRSHGVILAAGASWQRPVAGEGRWRRSMGAGATGVNPAHLLD